MKKISILIVTLSLIISGCSSSNSETTAVTPTPVIQNQAPISNAGSDQNIDTASVVTLDGNASSDADGDTLTYLWSLTTVPTGSNAVLSSTTVVTPTFTADIDGTYIAELTVNDGSENSTSDSVSVVATTPNTPPTADAGVDQNVVTTSVVTLDGSASSDANGDAITYQWSLSALPTGSNASLNNAAAVSPTFTPDVDGTYTAELVVNDGLVDSAVDVVTIVAATPNSTPVANAGPDQNVETSSVVTLNGSGSSDADGDTLSYQWTLSTVPAGSSAALNGQAIVSPSFTADLDGDYVAELIVSDGQEMSLADSVTIISATANSAPVANAGVNQNVLTGATVTLDASASTDADGDGLIYTWAFVSLPSGSLASLDSNQVVDPSFTADLEGSYVLSLVVNDGTVDSNSDTIVVDVIQPRVKLFKKAGFGGTYNEFSLPFTSNSTVSATVVGSSTISLDTFRLLAEGQNFTISNLSATDSSGQVTPDLTVLSNGFVLVDGTEVDFELISPLTGGKTVNLVFTFQIQETGDTFTSNYTFTSN